MLPFLHSLTTLNHRLPRTPYIKRMVLAHVLLFAALISLLVIMGPDKIHYLNNPTRTLALCLIPAVLIAATFIIGTSAIVRRLHDVNLSGLWAILILLLSIVPLLAPVCFVILAILPGSPTTNRFNKPE